MEWTCSACEKQVDERNFDTEERMCDDCMDLAYPDAIKWVSPRDPGDENDSLHCEEKESNDNPFGLKDL